MGSDVLRPNLPWTAFVVFVSLVLLASPREARADDDEARPHFEKGVELYGQAHFEQALAAFAEAYRLSSRPKLLFNMASCEERLGHFDRAAQLLRRYLSEEPSGEERAELESRIQSLEEREKNLLVALRKQSTPEPPPRLGVGQRYRGTFIALSVAGALGLSSIGLGGGTVGRNDALASDCGQTAMGCTPDQVDEVRRLAVTTDVFIGLTGAAAIATITLAIVESRRSGRSR
jgi:tetratricopeptide (TPR) repeat protein